MLYIKTVLKNRKAAVVKSFSTICLFNSKAEDIYHIEALKAIKKLLVKKFFSNDFILIVLPLQA
jgi:hypothetical protein